MTADDINRYIFESAIARRFLEATHELDLTSLEIQQALVERLGIPDTTYLPSQNLSAQKIVEVLAGYDFRVFRPEILGVVELGESVLPEGTPQLLLEAKVKAAGEIWDVHRTDADPFPSDPHAHNRSSGLKADLSNGNLYNKRDYVNKMTVKNLKRLRKAIKAKVSGITLPKLAV